MVIIRRTYRATKRTNIVYIVIQFFPESFSIRVYQEKQINDKWDYHFHYDFYAKSRYGKQPRADGVGTPQVQQQPHRVDDEKSTDNESSDVSENKTCQWKFYFRLDFLHCKSKSLTCA